MSLVRLGYAWLFHTRAHPQCLGSQNAKASRRKHTHRSLTCTCRDCSGMLEDPGKRRDDDPCETVLLLEDGDEVCIVVDGLPIHPPFSEA